MYFVHLSDTHIMAAPERTQHGVDTAATLARAVAQINALEPPPAFAILTGDLINDDEPQSYRRLKMLLAPLRVPVYFALGNHDLRLPFRRILLEEEPPRPERYFYSFAREGYRFLVLDSLVEGEVGGALGEAQLAWLAEELARHAQAPTLLFVHHPPVPIGVPWLDEHVLADGPALLDVLRRHPQVLRVFFGHVHMAVQVTASGVTCSSVPSTCYQFGDGTWTPKYTADPPAYGLVQLHRRRVASRLIFF